MLLLIIVVLYVLLWGGDRLLRRKKWHENTRQEKQSILIGAACVPAYVLLSILGILLVIADPGAESNLGGWMYEAAVMIGRFNWLVALGAMVSSLILRKRGSVQYSKLVHFGAMGYLALFGVLCLAAGIL